MLPHGTHSLLSLLLSQVAYASSSKRHPRSDHGIGPHPALPMSAAPFAPRVPRQPTPRVPSTTPGAPLRGLRAPPRRRPRPAHHRAAPHELSASGAGRPPELSCAHAASMRTRMGGSLHPMARASSHAPTMRQRPSSATNKLPVVAQGIAPSVPRCGKAPRPSRALRCLLPLALAPPLAPPTTCQWTAEAHLTLLIRHSVSALRHLVSTSPHQALAGGARHGLPPARPRREGREWGA